MLTRRRLAWLPLVGLFVLLLAACDGVVASDLPGDAELEDSGEVIEFTGTVEALGPMEWTVSGISFAINPGTEIEGGLALGDTVKIYATLDGESVVLAQEIESFASESDELDDADDDGDNGDEREFVGMVESIDGNSWTVDGKELTVDGSTEIDGAIAEGDTVKVHASAGPDGTLVAREIELVASEDVAIDEQDDDEAEDQEDQDSDEGAFDDDGTSDEREFRGVLQSIDGNRWVIDGVSVLVTESTDIEDNPQIGDNVKVETITDAFGNLVATEIERTDDDEGDASEEQEDADEDEDREDDREDHDDEKGDDDKYGQDEAETEED